MATQTLTEITAREARRKKIQELEASLFGGENGTNRNVITGLPELQNVNEYSQGFGQAEKRKTSALPTLKKEAVKKFFMPDPGKVSGHHLTLL